MRTPGEVHAAGSLRASARVVSLTPELDALADELARQLSDVPLGLPLSELARRLRRRQSDVRRVLRTDPRFGSEGVTRGRRWYLHDARRGSRAGMGRNLTAGSGLRASSQENAS